MSPPASGMNSGMMGAGMQSISAPVLPPPPISQSGSYAPLSSSGGAGAQRGGPRFYPVSTDAGSAPVVQLQTLHSPGPGSGSNGYGASGNGGDDARGRTNSNAGYGVNSSGNTNLEKRIDPASMPRPVVQTNRFYDTAQSSKKAPPPAGSSFVVQDGGNCSPRHMRATMCCPPTNAAIAKDCPIPFAVVATPFAAVEGPEEAVVAAVECADSAPPRCSRCRGYINPAVAWVDNGSKWQCNLCGMQNDVADAYYCSLDGSGLRMDRASRPELCAGSLDFVVGPEYCSRPDAAPAYVFAIDISPRALTCGATMASLQATEECIRALRAAFEETQDLYGQHSSNINQTDVHPNDSPAPLSDVAVHARVGVFTYHRSIQYYSVRPDHTEKVKMHIVDSWDPIAALPPSLWLKSIAEEWDEIELLLERIPELVATEQGLDKDSGYNTAGGYSGTAGDLQGACTGAAMKSAQLALDKTGSGGRVFILTPNGPTIGCPKVAKREQQTSYCGPNEVALYGAPEAQSSTGKENQALCADVETFVELATDCAKSAVCVDVLLLLDGEEYRDAAMLGHVCDISGGSLYLIRGSVSEADNALRLEQQLSHCIRRCAGRDAICKIRTSAGFKLSRYYSKGVQRSYDAELELAGVDEESTFVGSFVYDGGVQEDEGMYIQLAILYTDNRRRRLVRVHNLCLRASSNHTRVFRGADLDAIAYAMVSQAAERAFTKPLSADHGPRDHIKITACDMLSSYRLHCSSHSPRGQLILPDSLKLLPLYCLGILKHPAFIDNVDLRGKTSLIRGHERAYELRRLRSCPVSSLIQSICPRVFECLKLSEATFDSSLKGQGRSGEDASASGIRSPNRRGGRDPAESSWRMQLAVAHTSIALSPYTAKVSAEALESSGVYLMDDGSTLYLHVGRSCTRVELEEWFGVAPHSRPPQVTFNKETSDTALYMARLIESLQSVSPHKQQLVVIWGDEPTNAVSSRFAMRLMEDSLYGTMSYTDFMCKLHASIQKLTSPQ